jgi:hypothetical protein
MSEPSNYSDPFRGIAHEIINAMSALNMEPEPLAEENGLFLSQRDRWAAHAMEHLRMALDLHRSEEHRQIKAGYRS